MVKSDFVRWFSELSKEDVAIAGGKGASLAEMYNTKVPVPAGFVVTAQAYKYFIEKSEIDDKIKEILSELDVNDTMKLNMVSKQIREIIEFANLPNEMEEEIVEAYEILDVKKSEESKNALEILEKREEPFVACRSSATTEDLVDASFAGQQDTFLNVKGKKELLEKVKKCMSSLFTARAIYYREKKGFSHDKAYLAVVIQKMINSEKSGVMFSKNPTSNDKSIVIEAVWGLGEGIVSGSIKPDHYVISADLENFKIVKEEVSKKKLAVIRNEEGKTETIKLSDELAEKRVLTNYEIKTLAQYAKQLEKHYQKPQDIEFAINKEGIFIVQSRPVTTVYKETGEEVEGEVLLIGLGASPGIGSGAVKVIHNLSELEKISEGDVLVVEMTNPDMVVSMQKAAAIVTDEGGLTSHAAIVSREMGIPAVVGTGEATKKLKDGDVITVDGGAGKVFMGRGETKKIVIEPIVLTKTEIKVIVDLPEYAGRAAKSQAKSVGLLRLEGIIASSGKHPIKFVKDGNVDEYVKLIALGIKKIAEPFEEVWIRTSDIRTDEFRDLEGAPEIEGNPMLGDHGIRFSLKHKDIMKAELMAVKGVAQEFSDKKFGIMMPQIISISEVKETKKIAQEVGIPENIHIGIMVETPAAVQIINELCEEGISFISFGTNDLTQYTLAIDRNNEEVQDIYNELHPAVLNSIKYVIRRCKKHNVKTSICGQAGSKPEMARFLVSEGIDSISVNADAARKISELVRELESGSLGADVAEEVSGGNVEEVSAGEEIGSEERAEEEAGEISKVGEEVNAPKKMEEIFGDEDIENAILRELDKNEYVPGDPNGRDMQDIPPLNEAIPVDANSFANENGGESKSEVEFKSSKEDKD